MYNITLLSRIFYCTTVCRNMSRRKPKKSQDRCFILSSNCYTLKDALQGNLALVILYSILWYLNIFSVDTKANEIFYGVASLCPLLYNGRHLGGGVSKDNFHIYTCP